MTRVRHCTGMTHWAKSPARELTATSAGRTVAVCCLDGAEQAVILSGGEIEGGRGRGQELNQR